MVIDTDSMPLANATVEVRADEEPLFNTTTDQTGDYILTNVSTGTYEVQATKTGYESTSRSVTVEANTTQSVSLVLVAAADDPPTDDVPDEWADRGLSEAQYDAIVSGEELDRDDMRAAFNGYFERPRQEIDDVAVSREEMREIFQYYFDRVSS